MERRTLVRVLVVVAIAIPILVEVLTFAGLMQFQLFGDGGDEPTPATPQPRRVAVGEELLPETPQRETLTDASLGTGSGQWTVTLTVQVENNGTTPYELRLEELTLGDGRTVPDGNTTRRLQPGETATVTARWRIPSGTTPHSVTVSAVRFDNDSGTPRTLTKRVHLAKIPVEGG
ncbi:hypothetical protein ACFR9U_10235 [Halorientalis brevis]|uniref:DUF11 domain-containing protein n=1 Tax=Halorientalis brevis TaxID=1126241 RepID=A0ABD6CBI1_9EURY|nr:hypothetical protein [Halorientalis brevis]